MTPCIVTMRVVLTLSLRNSSGEQLIVVYSATQHLSTAMLAWTIHMPVISK